MIRYGWICCTATANSHITLWLVAVTNFTATRMCMFAACRCSITINQEKAYPLHSVTREPELQEWVTCGDPEVKAKMPVTEEIALAVDRFYFNHYCKHFRSGAFARANCSM
jgi:hypothetical protein